METINNISIIFMAIFFEAIPFLLMGSFLSSIIERYISNDRIEKLIPKNIILGSIIGIILGFFIPACDCAVIPISKRLIKKKVPLNVAISFMLSSPIINPVVLLSTYQAFYRTEPSIFWLRVLLGIIISLIVGIILGLIYSKQNVIKHMHDNECECGHSHHHEKENHHEHNQNELVLNCGEELITYHRKEIKEKKFSKDILFILNHASEDFFDVLKYLMFGALLASLTQVLMPQRMLQIFSDSKALSIIILMIFAYLMSLCSTSDSFVGKSLLSSFTKTSILAYLLLGPMIDIKNTIVLLGNYKKKFVITLISTIFITIFLVCLVVIKL